MKVDVATNILSSGIRLPMSDTLSSPRMREYMSAEMAVNVVDFMPPPVPDGDAPTYIRKVSPNKIGTDSTPIGIELNPEVVMANHHNGSHCTDADQVMPEHALTGSKMFKPMPYVGEGNWG